MLGLWAGILIGVLLCQLYTIGVRIDRVGKQIMKTEKEVKKLDERDSDTNGSNNI